MNETARERDPSGTIPPDEQPTDHVVMAGFDKLAGEAVAQAISSAGFDVEVATAEHALEPRAHRAGRDLFLLLSRSGEPVLETVRTLSQRENTTVMVVAEQLHYGEEKAVRTAGAKRYISAEGGLFAVLGTLTLETVYGGRDLAAPKNFAEAIGSDSSENVVRWAHKTFTESDWETLKRIMQADSTRSIAEDLGVPLASVKSNIQNLLTNCRVHSRVELVAFARQHGLMQPEEPADVPQASGLPNANISRSEYHILNLMLAEGLTIRQIAFRLEVGPPLIQLYINRLHRKFGMEPPPRPEAPAAEPTMLAGIIPERELEVLSLIVEGHSTEIIADKLGIDTGSLSESEWNVTELIAHGGASKAEITDLLNITNNELSVLLRSTYRKLGVNSRLQLGAHITERGLKRPEHYHASPIREQLVLMIGFQQMAQENLGRELGGRGYNVETATYNEAIATLAERKDVTICLLAAQDACLTREDVRNLCRKTRAKVVILGEDHAPVAPQGSAKDILTKHTAGYVSLRHSLDVLFDALKRVVDGQRVNEVWSTPSTRRVTPDLSKLRIRALSHREREVLELTIDGMSKKAIATILGISHNTVRTHHQSMLWKLNVHSSSEAASLVYSFISDGYPGFDLRDAVRDILGLSKQK